MTRWIVAIVLITLGGAGSWWIATEVSARRCDGAVMEAEARLAAGDPAAALALLDRTDARCNCGRFTSGDAPPEYALAVTSLEALRKQQGEVAVATTLAAARGPILQALARERRNEKVAP